jgi:hypothetical protein
MNVNTLQENMFNTIGFITTKKNREVLHLVAAPLVAQDVQMNTLSS